MERTPGLPHEAWDLAWWGTAWIRGLVPADDLLGRLAEDGRSHLVVHDGSEGPLLDLLALLRRAGTTRLGLALPVEGDPLGLGGPGGFNSLALEQGQAVVGDAGLGVVPDPGPEVVHWHVHPARPRTVPDVGEADRGLRETLRRATEDLVRLDVARWRPEVADALMDLRRTEPEDPVPGVPGRCLDLAGRARNAAWIVALATVDDGGALSASAANARSGALRELERAARRALVAACSPEAWPRS